MSEVKAFDITWGMLIDIDKCTGCGACMVACQAENNVAPIADASNKLRSVTWMLVFETNNGKNYPDGDIAYIPRPCQQCATQPCATVCPVIATERNEEGGIVSQIYPRCIGCRYCMAACPYHSRYFNWFDPIWPTGMDKTLTPDVSTRPRGVVEKCSFCHHRFMHAKDALRAKGQDVYVKGADGKRHCAVPEEAYVTACAEACPNNAITFGDLNNPEHKVHKLIKDNAKHTFRLLERLGTEPAVYYMSSREWVRRQGDNYLESEKTQEPKARLFEHAKHSQDNNSKNNTGE